MTGRMQVHYMLSNIIGKDFMYSEVLLLEKANGTYEYIQDYAVREEKEGGVVRSLGAFLNYAKENEEHMYEGVTREDIVERVDKYCKYMEVERGNNEIHHILHYTYQDITDLFLFGGDMELLLGTNIMFEMEAEDKLHSFLVDFQTTPNRIEKNFAEGYGIMAMYEKPLPEICYALSVKTIEYHLQGSHYRPEDYGGKIPKGIADYQRYTLQGQYGENAEGIMEKKRFTERDVRFYLAEQSHLIHYAQQIYSNQQKAEQFQKIIDSEGN